MAVCSVQHSAPDILSEEALSEPRTIRVGLPLAGISVQDLRELRHVVIYADEDEGECAVLMPYHYYLELQSPDPARGPADSRTRRFS